LFKNEKKHANKPKCKTIPKNNKKTFRYSENNFKSGTNSTNARRTMPKITVLTFKKREDEKCFTVKYMLSTKNTTSAIKVIFV
jgi:hypothetical protein